MISIDLPNNQIYMKNILKWIMREREGGEGRNEFVLYSHINHKCYTYAKTQSADSNTQATPLFRYERLLTS